MKPILTIAIFFNLLFMSVCAVHANDSKETDSQFSVHWYPQAAMITGIFEHPRKVKSQEDFHLMRFDQWHSQVDIVSKTNNNSVIPISSCDEYFSLQNGEWGEWTYIYEREYRRLMGFAQVCQIAELISKAQPPKTSTLTYPLYPLTGATLPEQLPAEVAYMLSVQYRKDLLQDPTIQTWSDILLALKSEITLYTSDELDQFRFETNDDGVQRISVLARGDFTGDGMEEILLRSSNSVKGYPGAGFIGLFILRPDGSGDRFQLVREFFY